jgi:hypothetical protein
MAGIVESFTEAREAILKYLCINGLQTHLLELLLLNLFLLLLKVVLHLRGL